MHDFLLSAPTPEAVIAFRPSEETQTRVHYLLEANRSGTLNDAHEASELDELSRVEHFVRMLKIGQSKSCRRSMSYIPEALRRMVYDRAESWAL
ncbi:MAG: hypothetical protein U0521_21095 [Anaerolineae bacterium]